MYAYYYYDYFYYYYYYYYRSGLIWSVGLMVEVSASQPRNRGFEPHTGHDHDSSYETSTGWFHEMDSRVI